MQNARHATLQPLLLEECLQGFPCRTEHAAVEERHVPHGKGMKDVRNGEYHMEVLHSGDDFLLAHLDPHLALLVLALRAMAVTAAVIAHVDLTAFGAYLHMSAEGTSPAERHGSEGLPHLRDDWVAREKLRSIVTNDLTDFEQRTAHFLKSLKIVSIRSTH